MIELPISELRKLPKYDNNIYWSDNGTLYKYSRETKKSYYYRKEFFSYVKSLPNIDGLLKPIELLSDGKVYGYEMEFKKGLSLEKLLSQKIINDDTYDIKFLMKKIITTLKEINKYFIFSDVRDSNILIDNNNLTFIDWDTGKMENDPYMIPPYYIITDDERIVRESILTDTIKGFICALSLYYGISLERTVANEELNGVKKVLESIKSNPYIIYYVDYLIDKVKSDDEYIELYFNEIIDSIDLPSTKEKERLEKVLTL